MTISVAVIGASGYTGAEAIRLLLDHPKARPVALSGDRHAGKPITDLYANFYGYDLPQLVPIHDIDFSKIDVALCCLPHGASHEIVSQLYRAEPHLRIIDLSADFRLKSPELYREWYKNEHSAPELLNKAVCGISELHRKAIHKARLVACPGCFPTGSTLALVPLLRLGLIDVNDIIIDAKTGASGAGRALKEGLLYCEVTEGMHAYGIACHRHLPETEQYLSWALGGHQDVKVSFTPHLVSMSRGIGYTIYVRLAKEHSAQDIRTCWAEAYDNEPFIRLLPKEIAPQTRHVQGSNFVDLNAMNDRISGRAICLASIDNLTKGSSGQAIQNMNIMFGFEETLGLMSPPKFP